MLCGDFLEVDIYRSGSAAVRVKRKFGTLSRSSLTGGSSRNRLSRKISSPHFTIANINHQKEDYGSVIKKRNVSTESMRYPKTLFRELNREKKIAN
jgi:hypothetical protein